MRDVGVVWMLCDYKKRLVWIVFDALIMPLFYTGDVRALYRARPVYLESSNGSMRQKPLGWKVEE